MRGIHIQRGLAVLTAICTWLLLVAGALVTSTGSGLSVPDWPLSYGQFMPPMVGGVFFEHGHRMVAGTVAILMLMLALATARWEPRKWVRVLAFTGMGMVLLQAVLGGLTVLLRLPPAVSIAHAMLGQSFFCVTAILAAVSIPGWEARAPGYRPENRSLFNLSAFITGCFFLQLFLGATVRHLHAGLAIPDFPTVYGGIFPPVWSLDVAVHFAHRTMAYLLCLGVLWLSLRILFSDGGDTIAVFLCLVWMGAVVFQVLFGALSIWLHRPAPITASHLALGALCLMISVLLTFRLGWSALSLREKSAALARGWEPA